MDWTFQRAPSEQWRSSVLEIGVVSLICVGSHRYTYAPIQVRSLFHLHGVHSLALFIVQRAAFIVSPSEGK